MVAYPVAPSFQEVALPRNNTRDDLGAALAATCTHGRRGNDGAKPDSEFAHRMAVAYAKFHGIDSED